jgi:hypothetical protein
VGLNGETSYLTLVGTTLRIRVLYQNLTISDYDTGIPPDFSDAANHKHLVSGIVAIICPVATTVFGDTNLGRHTAAVATYNYASTVYQYYDITLYGGSTSITYFGAIQEVEAGKIRWSYGNTNGVNMRVMELTGL